uniref:Uncharacterized protein n=1 Tax=Avena sativa TaxID=4498 RepID=A0ACD5YCD5_AVESA
MGIESMDSSVALVAVPFPAQGHLNQLMHLSLLVASRGLSVHYAAPAAHVRQAKSRVHGWDAKALASIHFHDLDVPTFKSPDPDPAAASPFPSHLLPMWETYSAAARVPLASLLERLSATHRRVVVVYDHMNSFAAAEAARVDGEAYGLVCVAISNHLAWMPDGHQLLRDRGLRSVPMDACMSKEFVEYMARVTTEAEGAGFLMNTCRALEGEFLDAVADIPDIKRQKRFAVGPLNPLLPVATEPKLEREVATPRHECMRWLDAQPPASVLYVSFGTTSSFLPEQIAELAAAIKGSKQRFIWVLRDADRADIFAGNSGGDSQPRYEKLLSEEQAQGTGLVITGWAPQLEILAHGATAAFMSHCGWNSTMESLSHGKPILAWPMHSDQPWDAELLCNYLRVAMLVRPWEKHGEVVAAEAIQVVIENAMLSEKGTALRQRAKLLGEAVRAAVADNGSSTKDLHDFVAHITRI